MTDTTLLVKTLLVLARANGIVSLSNTKVAQEIQEDIETTQKEILRVIRYNQMGQDKKHILRKENKCHYKTTL